MTSITHFMIEMLWDPEGWSLEVRSEESVNEKKKVLMK